jgi:hypothetical protein
MEIVALADAVYEDLEPQVVAARLNTDVLVLTLECDDWGSLAHRRTFNLTCKNVRESNLEVGAIGGLAYATEHPVLMSHIGSQGQLFFSSAPFSPEEVFYLTHRVLTDIFWPWRMPQEFMNGGPEELYGYLKGGSGLLARGPTPVLEELAGPLNQKLKVSVVESHSASSRLCALLVDSKFVICEAVEVEEC